MRTVLAFLLSFPDPTRGWILKAALQLRAIIKSFGPDVLISSGPPHGAHIVAFLATRGLNVTWWVDLRDPWTDARNSELPLTRLEYWFESLVMRAASGVLTTTPKLADRIESRFPDITAICVRNGVDPELFPDGDVSTYPGLSIAHVGTLYSHRSPEPVIRGFCDFLQDVPEAREAGSRMRLAGRVDQTLLPLKGMYDPVEFLGVVPREEALEVLRKSTVGLVLAQDQELMVPAKLYETFALNSHVLVITEPESASAAIGAELGVHVAAPDDHESIRSIFNSIWGGMAESLPSHERLHRVHYRSRAVDLRFALQTLNSI